MHSLLKLLVDKCDAGAGCCACGWIELCNEVLNLHKEGHGHVNLLIAHSLVAGGARAVDAAAEVGVVQICPLPRGGGANSEEGSSEEGSKQ